MRSTFRLTLLLPATLLLLICLATKVGAEPASTPATTGTQEPTDNTGDATESWKDRALDALPTPISDGLDVNLWGWFSYLHNDQSEYSNLYDVELSLDVTKSFGQRVALSGEVNFLDANGELRTELEQGYLSALLWKDGGTIFTLGRFNANFGVEARDYWNRDTGTTSLLFGAQPQDLIGLMVTQPVGTTNLTLRPFLSADFQADYDFNQPPAGGLQMEYRPCKTVDLAVTNWVGPGIVLGPGQHLRSPYDRDGYGDSATTIFSNWQGPDLSGNRGGTLYFLEAKASWQATTDLTLSTEYLLGTTGSSNTRYGWYGCMVLANYDITDRLHVFARFSYLYDSDWLITGEFQHLYEASGGGRLRTLQRHRTPRRVSPRLQQRDRKHGQRFCPLVLWNLT